MSKQQDMWIDLYVPYKKNEYVGTELSEEIFKAIAQSEYYPLNNTQGDINYPWITLDHDEDNDKENLQYDFFCQMEEFSKKYPRVVFQVDTHSIEWGEDIRTNFLNGESEDIEVTTVYGESQWMKENPNE